MADFYGVEVTFYPGTYDIGFGDRDETEFDADTFEELVKCWEGFCKENDISPDCVNYVERAWMFYD